MNITSDRINKIKKEYSNNGFVLLKNFLPKNECKQALKWLNKKNKKKLAKTWTEQEPGVDLAVYFVVHKKNCNVNNNCTVNKIDSKIQEELIMSVIKKAAMYEKDKKK